MNPNTHLVSDSWTLAVRMLKHNIRSADTIMTVLAMPLMIMLAFVFVLGGAMNTGGQGRYVDYIVPVVTLFVMASGIAYTAFRVNQDLTTGMYDRFRTMPIARASLVLGQVVASLIGNAVSVLLIVGFAFAFGYRPHFSGAGGLIAAGLLVGVLIAFSLMGVAFGMAAKTNEGSGMFAYLLMALLFVSSGFAPTSTMPAGLRAFADHQPITPIVNALRDAQFGRPAGSAAAWGFVWVGVMIVVFAVMAAWAAKHAERRRPA